MRSYWFPVIDIKIVSYSQQDLSSWVELLSSFHKRSFTDTSINPLLLGSYEISDNEYFIAGMDGTIICGIARLRFNDDGFCYITDLYLRSNRYSAAFLFELMQFIRERDASQAVVWVCDSESGIADLLSDFTFEISRVNYLLRKLLLHAPLKKKCEIDCAFQRAPDIYPIDVARVPALNLGDIIEFNSSHWIPCRIILPQREIDPAVIAFYSSLHRKTGWLRFVRATLDVDASTLDYIQELSTYLYEKGCREIFLEIGADKSVKDALLELGFGIDRTYFELVLHLEYET
jgi:hypothetical protein